MKELFEDVMKTLEAERIVNDKDRNPLKRISKNIQLVDEEMGGFIVRLSFCTPYCTEEDVQVECNKNYFPRLYGKLLLYRKLFDLENQRLHSTQEKYADYCASELGGIRQFFIDHRTFCLHFYAGDVESHRLLFTRAAEEERPLQEKRDPVPDEANTNTVLLAWLYAYEEYREVLQQKPGQSALAVLPESERTYKGAIIGLVELIMYLWISQEILIDGEPAGQEYIKTAIEQMAGVEIDNFAQRVYSLKNRKKELFSNFEVIKRKLLAHLGQLKDDRPRKRAA